LKIGVAGENGGIRQRENESEGGGSKRTVRGSLVCGDEER